MSKIVIIFLATACLAWAAEQPTANKPQTEPDPAPPASKTSWTEDYRVGPGDQLTIQLYGKPETARPPVTILPDGTISYLQVQNLKVEGLTIEGSREAIQQELGKFYKNAEVIVQPVLLESKRFVILGRVTTKGSFIMDHPITIVEAIAQAQGFETGFLQPTTAGLADLSRSFLIRDGSRLDVNFEKLFLEGDYSQNVQIEPNDFLYFPSAGVQEVYVLGALNSPGKLDYLPGATVMGALAAAGSFNTEAWRDRVMIIRGSLNNPEIIVVDTNDILKGRAKDVPLKPKDIVYVSTRPWRIAEELVDTAVSAFITSMVNQWTGANIIVGTRAVLPQLD